MVALLVMKMAGSMAKLTGHYLVDTKASKLVRSMADLLVYWMVVQMAS